MPAAPPPSETVVTVASQVMLSAAGIRMRMSWAAVIVGLELSVTVSVLAVVEPCPTVKTWFAAEERAASVMMVFVLSSVAAVAPPAPDRTSWRLLADEAAVKFVNLSPAIVNWSLPAKLVVTLILTVLLLSS